MKKDDEKFLKEVEILNLCNSSVENLLEKLIGREGEGGLTLERMKKVLEIVAEVTQRITEICLFLDTNYCKKVGKESILQRLESVSKTLGVKSPN